MIFAIDKRTACFLTSAFQLVALAACGEPFLAAEDEPDLADVQEFLEQNRHAAPVIAELPSDSITVNCWPEMEGANSIGQLF